MRNKILINLIIGIFLISFASAYLPHQINTNLTFSFSDDEAGGCNVSTMDYPSGSVWINQEMGETVNTFNATILSGNFTELGSYCFNIECEDGYGNVCREITTNGELANQSKLILSGILLSILFLFFIIALIGLVKLEDYRGKFALYWVCHILIISISFIAWQTAGNYLSMDGGLAGIFKISFYFFTIAVLPMLFLSIAWIFYIHTFNDHIRKLLDKGENPETAFRIANKRSGGWFSGK